MASCEQYQAQLLGYLYDLPETEERQVLREHLEQCGSCQAALVRAEQQKRLLAAAAKAQFPAVRFQAPPADEVIVPEETPAWQIPFPRRLGLGGAIAASVLLLLGFGGAATIWSWHFLTTQRYAQQLSAEYHAKTALALRLRDEHQATVTRKQQKFVQVQEEIRRLVGQQQQKRETLQKAARERPLNVVVSGPQTLQPGASNTYDVVTVNQNNQLVPSQLDVRVVDGKQLLFQQNYLNRTGEQQISLPANLPLTANSNLLLEVVAKQTGGRQQQVRQLLELAAPVYITHLATDKPIYRPGETVYFRSLTLERFSLKPAQEDFRLLYTVTKPTGEEVPILSGSLPLFDPRTQSPLLGPDDKPIRSIGAGEFRLDPGAPAGAYTLTVREASNRFAAQQRPFIVCPHENARLHMELDFTRKSYSPGDAVVVACKVSRVGEGGSVAHQPVSATMHIDGKPYGPDGTEGARPLVLGTDEKGAVNLCFQLPKQIEKGQATLAVQFHDGAATQTVVRPIPIVVKKLQIDFYPEGGDLVADVPNRVYFQARTLLDKPAELSGRIIDQDGTVVVPRVQTLHDDREPGINQGMGLFAFTPQAGRKYELKIATPEGIEGKYELPAVKENGVVLSIPQGVSRPAEPIQVVVYSAGKDRRLLIGAYCRGRMMDHRSVRARKGAATTVALHPAQEMGGVYRITVFEELGAEIPNGEAKVPAQGSQQVRPVAERLVYRKPAERLCLTVKPDKQQYRPGERVKLSVTARNEQDQPTAAILLVAVVDKSVLTAADERAVPSMPTHYYLTTEVRRPEDLEYADVLLGSHPKADAALDLLLGTQGWRRFAEQNPGRFRQQFQEDAERLLATIGQASGKPVDAAQPGEPPQAQLATQLAKLQEEEAKARDAWVAVRADKEFASKMDSLQQELHALRAQQQAVAGWLEAQRAWIERIWAALLPALAAIFAALVTVVTVLAIRRRLRPALPHYALVGVCSLSVLGVAALLLKMELGKAKPVAVAELPPAPELNEPIARAEGRSGDPAAKDRELRVGLLQRLEADEIKKENDEVGQDAAGAHGGKGQGEGKGGLPAVAAGASPDASEKSQKPSWFFRDGANANGAATARKKAWAEEEQQRAPGASRLAQDRARELFSGIHDRQLPQAEVRPELASKEMAKPPLLANREQAMSQAKVSRLGGSSPGGFAGAAPAVEAGKAQAGARGSLGGIPSGPAFGLTDKSYRGEAPKLPSQVQKRLPPPQPLAIREYAHVRPGRAAEARSDSVDTVYWHPVLVLRDGKAEVSFDLGDAAAAYQITAVGHTLDGRLGAVSGTLKARLP